MTQPLISVIIPCFNDGTYLQEAVDSAIATDYPNLEIIVVDDGSTDRDTLSVIQAITCAGAGVYLITQPRNTGLAAARNAGIRAARGEWIMPLDSDDRIKSRALADCVRAVNADDRVGVVYGSVRYFGSEDKVWTPPDVTACSLLDFNHISACALFRKQAWVEAGGYEEVLFRQSWEDWDFWLSLLERGWQFRRIPEVIFEYRQRPESLSRCTQDASVRRELFTHIYRRHKTIYLAAFEELLLLKADRDWVIHDQHKQIMALSAELESARQLQRDIRWLLALRDGVKRLVRWPGRKPCL